MFVWIPLSLPSRLHASCVILPSNLQPHLTGVLDTCCLLSSLSFLSVLLSVYVLVIWAGMLLLRVVLPPVLTGTLFFQKEMKHVANWCYVRSVTLYIWQTPGQYNKGEIYLLRIMLLIAENDWEEKKAARLQLETDLWMKRPQNGSCFFSVLFVLFWCFTFLFFSLKVLIKSRLRLSYLFHLTWDEEIKWNEKEINAPWIIFLLMLNIWIESFN